MSEQRWALFYDVGRDRDYRHGYAQQNPHTGAWTSVMEVTYATTFPTDGVALSALTIVRPRLTGAPWRVALVDWTLRRLGDVDEPITRFHEDVRPLAKVCCWCVPSHEYRAWQYPASHGLCPDAEARAHASMDAATRQQGAE